MKFPYFFLLTILTFLSFSSFSQNQDFEFGDVTISDLEDNTCEIDPSAEAYVIKEFGKTKFEDGKYIFYRHIKIKILNADGLDWGNFSKTIYQKGIYGESMYLRKGSTFNLEDGQVREYELGKSDIIKEEITENKYSWKFSLPKVKSGSIVEYIYTFYNPDITDFPNWSFQKSIPVKESKYMVIYNEVLGFRPIIMGIRPISESINLDKLHGHIWIARDLPGLKKDRFSPNIEDYRTKIVFAITSFRARDGYTYDYMKSYGRYAGFQYKNNFELALEHTAYLKKIVQPLIDPDSLQTAQNIYNEIAHNFTESTRKTIYINDLREAWNNKKGTIAEINMNLVGAYKKAGFKAYPVISSSSGNGLLHSQYPTPGCFDYLLCGLVLNNKVHLIDASDTYGPWDEIPPIASNDKGLLLTPDNMKWINLSEQGKYKKVTMIEIDLNKSEGQKITQSFSSYSARSERIKIYDDGEDDYKRLVAEQLTDFDVNDFVIENINNQEKPLNLNLDVEYNFNNDQSDYIYIDPVLLGKIQENLFTESKREMPIDLGAIINNTYSLQLTIPQGYDVESVPRAIMITLPNKGGKFIFQASQIGQKIIVSMRLDIKKSIFPLNEYNYLREFYSQIIEKQNEKIVLKKL
ncbi:DUF3858 domain-containing protein [bacterium SCSIO 12643]|nr:DUF3858 domain-containing protein [bacterium SCSIO 12643]